MPPSRYQSLSQSRRRRSSAPVILIVVLVAFIAFVAWLAMRDISVPPQRIEQDATNALAPAR